MRIGEDAQLSSDRIALIVADAFEVMAKLRSINLVFHMPASERISKLANSVGTRRTNATSHLY